MPAFLLLVLLFSFLAYIFSQTSILSSNLDTWASTSCAVLDLKKTNFKALLSRFNSTIPSPHDFNHRIKHGLGAALAKQYANASNNTSAAMITGRSSQRLAELAKNTRAIAELKPKPADLCWPELREQATWGIAETTKTGGSQRFGSGCAGEWRRQDQRRSVTC